MNEQRTDENVSIDQLCAQIDDIGHKANHLIDSLRDQRDTALEMLREIKSCLEFKDEHQVGVQVIAGQGERFWALLSGLYRSDV